MQQVSDWPYSTFHDVKAGIYPAHWGGMVPKIENQNFGEFQGT